MKRLTVCVVGALLSLAAPTLFAAPSLDAFLVAIGAHVVEFERQFSLVVGDEAYSQLLRDMNGRSRQRLLRSDVFFFNPSSDGPAMTVRTVLRVDGRAVQQARERVDEALALPPGDRTAKLRALANASASYNLGTLQRNFNEPTLALTFAAPDFQRRFKFTLEGTTTVDDEVLSQIGFTEVERPTIIRDGRSGANIPASGRLWTTDAGALTRTELRLARSDVRATITVSYRHDPHLDMMVPATMDEEYRYRDKDTRRFVFISGHATYSNYRRFETSVRILTP